MTADAKKLVDRGAPAACLCVWSCLAAARFAAYDANYFFLGLAALASTAAALALCGLFVCGRRIFRGSLPALALFLVTSSPPAVAAFVFLADFRLAN